MGKALGVAAPLLLVPAAAIGVAAMALNSGGLAMAMDLPRLGVMVAVYLAYFAVFMGIALMVSALAPSARVALVVLLGFWFFNCLVAARIASDAAKLAHPAPSAIQFDQAIAKEAKGHGGWDDQVKAVTWLLAEHHVTDAKRLPVNPEAVALDEGERRDAQDLPKAFRPVERHLPEPGPRLRSGRGPRSVDRRAIALHGTVGERSRASPPLRRSRRAVSPHARQHAQRGDRGAGQQRADLGLQGRPQLVGEGSRRSATSLRGWDGRSAITS